MNCPYCGAQLAEGTTICFSCGKVIGATGNYYPSQQTNTGQQGWSPYSGNQYSASVAGFSPSVKYTGYVGGMAIVAWLLALLGPFIMLTRTATGLVTLIPDLIDGTITDITDSVLSTWDLEETFSGVSALWDSLKLLFEAVAGGLANFIWGMLLLVIILIPIIIMIANMRNNRTTAKVLLIINLCLSIFGNWLCYSVVLKIYNAIGIIRSPYDNAPIIGTAMLLVSAGLWLGGTVVYFMLAGKAGTKN